MADFGNDPGLWAAKGLGSAAGAAVSLVYMLPKGRREAASRFFTGPVSYTHLTLPTTPYV